MKPKVELTGQQKAAAVLVQLGRDVAARVLRSMTETEAVTITLEIANLPSLDKEYTAQLMNEFVDSVVAIKAVGQGGVEAAREILAARLSPHEADEILQQFSDGNGGNPLGFLSHVEAYQVASFLQDEHPQTTAVILSYLPSDTAAQIVAAMPEEMRATVARRVAMLERVDPLVLESTASVLQRKLAGMAKSGPTSTRSGLQSLVEILNNIDQGTEKRILSDLDVIDPELADRVRGQMFVFEDVMALDDRTLQRILRQIVPKDLAVALKGVTPPMRDVVLRNLSERTAMDLVDEIDTMGPVRLSTVEASQAAVVRVVRELEAAGEITLTRSNEEMVT